jgi:hypothetical protein
MMRYLFFVIPREEIRHHLGDLFARQYPREKVRQPDQDDDGRRGDRGLEEQHGKITE